MSPQLNYWLYGYSPSEFDQEIRWGGFRAMVFLGHGLSVAFFMMTAVISSTALWRTQIRSIKPLPAFVTWCYLNFILVICKGLGALTYAVIYSTRN